MSGVDIVRLRLRNQQIAQQDFRTPAELVSHLGAVQAQDFSGGKWAIGLRLPNATEAAIEQAIADQKIVRTWPMRRTLHFVPAEDVRWMLALTATRAEAKSAARRRRLELDDRTLALSKDVLLRALSGGKQLTRQAIYGLLVAAGIRLEGGGPLDSGQPRGLHILAYHAQTGLICYGRHQGKQPAFALLDEWVPQTRSLERDEALTELAKRYFKSHGPATVHDFAWWSGLTVGEARTGSEMAHGEIVEETIDGMTYWLPADRTSDGSASAGVYLLPPFDEYTVAYKDRGAVVAPAHAPLAASGGVFRSIIVVDGQVAGTWKAAVRKGAMEVIPSPFGGQSRIEENAVCTAAKRYSDFRGLPLAES